PPPAPASALTVQTPPLLLQLETRNEDLCIEVDRLRAREAELLVEVGRWRGRAEVWEIRSQSRSRSQSVSHHGPSRSRQSRLGGPSQPPIDEGQGESEDPGPADGSGT